MNRRGLEQTAGRLCTQGLLIATGPLLAHAVGPVGRGEAAVGVAVGVLLPPLAGVGFGSAIRAKPPNNGNERRRFLRAGIGRVLIGGIVGLAVAVLLLGSGRLDVDNSLWTPIMAIGATVGVSAWVDGFVSLRLLDGQGRQVIATRVLPVALFACYCVALFATDLLTPLTYLWGYALLPVARFLTVSVGGVRQPSTVEPGAVSCSTTKLAWWRWGRWGIPHEIADAGLAHVALLAAGLSLSAADVGLLSVGLTISRVPAFLASGFSDGDVQQIASVRVQAGHFPLGRRLRSLLLASGFVTLMTAAAGWLAIPIVWGDPFLHSRWVLLALLVTAPLAAMLNYLSGYLVATGLVRYSATLQLIVFLLSGALAGLLSAAAGGPVAAAIGLSVAIAVTAAIAAARTLNLSAQSGTGADGRAQRPIGVE